MDEPLINVLWAIANRRVCVSSSVRMRLRMRMLALWCKNWKSNTRKTTRDSAAIPLVLVAIATDKVTWHFGFYLGPVPRPGVVSHSKQIAVLLALVTRFVEFYGIAAAAAAELSIVESWPGRNTRINLASLLVRCGVVFAVAASAATAASV